jgi:hypothetical protein
MDCGAQVYSAKSHSMRAIESIKGVKMSDAQAIKQQRTKLFEDTYNNIIPERVPINVNICIEAVAELGGLNVRDVNWNPPSAMPAAFKICQEIYSDICPANLYNARFPGFYEMSKSKSFRMGSSGFVQHPEVMGMLPEEYDYLIEKPVDCLLEKVIPRLYKGFDSENPMETALAVAKTVAIKNADMFASLGLMAKLNEQYGYFADNGMARAMTTAPFDFIADQLRGFSKIPGDVRRIPDKVLAACEAVYPLMVKAGIPHVKTPYSRAFSYLHMPTFMREADFSKFWWPTFLRMCNELSSMGIQTDTFCEDDWIRYLDYVYELPANSLIKFEYGDPQVIKDKLGKKHILAGLYPLTLLKTGTKQQCVDKAKELIDILAPGGKYIFSFDKVIITASSINVENLKAVTEYVRDNAKYSNAGETAGLGFKQEDYKVTPCNKIESRYLTTAEQYKAENTLLTDAACAKMRGFDDSMLDFFVKLLF